MEACWLVHNGVPFDAAFQLDDLTRFAFCIIFASFQGQTFDYARMRFEETKA